MTHDGLPAEDVAMSLFICHEMCAFIVNSIKYHNDKQPSWAFFEAGTTFDLKLISCGDDTVHHDFVKYQAVFWLLKSLSNQWLCEAPAIYVC